MEFWTTTRNSWPDGIFNGSNETWILKYSTPLKDIALARNSMDPQRALRRALPDWALMRKRTPNDEHVRRLGDRTIRDEPWILFKMKDEEVPF